MIINPRQVVLPSASRPPPRNIRTNLVKTSPDHSKGVWAAAAVIGAASVLAVVALLLGDDSKKIR